MINSKFDRAFDFLVTMFFAALVVAVPYQAMDIIQQVNQLIK